MASAQADAAVVHLHARDEKGDLTTDLRSFSKTVDIIKASCDIMLQASTGGLSTLTAAANPQVEVGSLNIGSLNFGDAVSQDSLPDVRFFDCNGSRGQGYAAWVEPHC